MYHATLVGGPMDGQRLAMQERNISVYGPILRDIFNPNGPQFGREIVGHYEAMDEGVTIAIWIPRQAFDGIGT